MHTHNGSHVDNRAGTLAQHDGQNGVYEVESALEVNGYHGVPLLLGHAHHETVLGDSGVVHQNVDTAEVLFHLVDHFLCLLEICGIGGISFCLHAHGCDFCFGFLAGLVDVEVGESYVGSLGGETQGKSLADAAGGAGDEGCFSFEKFHSEK